MAKQDTRSQQDGSQAGLETNLQDVVDGVEDELIVIDREYRVKFANAAVQSRFQKGAESIVGQLCYKVLHNLEKPCAAPLWDCTLRQVLNSGNTATVIHPDPTLGADRYLRIMAYPIRDNQGAIKAIVEMRRDITTERELENQVTRGYHELLALSRISAALSGLWDLDAILRVALDNVLNIMNGTIGGILLLDEQTQTLSYRVHQGFSAGYIEEMRIKLGEGITGQVAESGRSILVEDISADPRAAYPDLVSTEGLKAFISVPLRSKDRVLGVINIASGTQRRFNTSDVHLLYSIGDQLGVAIEQARLYERLRGARERLRRLARQNLAAEEEERRRIARELHDETSQSLSGLALQLQALVDIAEMSGNQEPEFINGLKKVQALTVQVHNEVSRLIRDLRPALLDTLGLVPAVRQYAESGLQPLDINVSFEVRGVEKRLPAEVEAGLFRVIQGAIGNIIQHSRAKNASVVLEYRGDEFSMRISDDGQGFDVSEITDIDESGRGRGLFSMRERIGSLGGTSGIESRPGAGTTVWAKIPTGQDTGDAEDKSISSR